MELFMDNLRNTLLRGKISREKEKEKSLLDSRLLIQGIVIVGLAFFMGMATGAHPGIPCGVALMTVLMQRSKGNIYALPLILLGLFLQLKLGYDFWGAAVIVSVCTLLFFILQKKTLSLVSRALISGVLAVGLKTIYYLWSGRFFLYDGLTAAIELLLLFAFIYVFYSFFQILEGGKSAIKSEAEAIAVMTAVLILTVTGINLGGGIPFSVTSFAGLFVPLFAGHRLGPMQGGMAGMVAGILILVTTGATPDLVGIFGFCGILAGLFRKQSRLLTAICFSAIAISFGLIQGFPDMYFSYYEPLAAAILFAMIPPQIVEGLCRLFPISLAEDEDREWTEKKKAKKMLMGYRDAFEKLALCCGSPQYRNPAKDVMALQFKGLTKTLDGILEDLSNPVKPSRPRRPQYQLQMGISSYARETGISGDSYLCEALGAGEYLMALSDGMGKGPRAAEESALTVNTLRDLLKAGFDVEVALRIINSVLLFKSADEIFSTVDMGLFDLYTGKMRLFKIGAAATFVKRGDQVKAIKISALPIGIVERIPIDSVEFKAKRGDEIVIVSDGITEAARGEGDLEWLEGAIRGIRSKDPQTMADLVINKAMERYGLKERDDMTVIVATVS